MLINQMLCCLTSLDFMPGLSLDKETDPDVVESTKLLRVRLRSDFKVEGYS